MSDKNINEGVNFVDAMTQVLRTKVKKSRRDIGLNVLYLIASISALVYVISLADVIVVIIYIVLSVFLVIDLIFNIARSRSYAADLKRFEMHKQFLYRMLRIHGEPTRFRPIVVEPGMKQGPASPTNPSE